MKKIFLLVILSLMTISDSFSQNKKNSVIVTCSDSDFNKYIKDKTMHLEVWRDRKWIQTLEYEFDEEFAMMHGVKKKFKMVDLNFDGFDDILILGGYSRVGMEPYYEAFFWNTEKGQFDFEPPFCEMVKGGIMKCDEEKRLIYSSEYHINGITAYFIYEFADGKYSEKATLFQDSQTGLYSYEFNWNLENDGLNWIPFDELSEEWKRAIHFKGFEF